MWKVLMLLVLAAATRWIPHPPNFTPILAMALIGGAYLTGWKRFALPIGVLLLSDVVFEVGYRQGWWAIQGFYQVQPFVYFAVVLIAVLGAWILRRRSWGRLIVGALASSILFFLISNFGVWVMGTMYPKTLEGLVMAYVAALPFFKNTLLSTLLFSAVMYAVLEWVLRREVATAHHG